MNVISQLWSKFLKPFLLWFYEDIFKAIREKWRGYFGEFSLVELVFFGAITTIALLALLVFTNAITFDMEAISRYFTLSIPKTIFKPIVFLALFWGFDIASPKSHIKEVANGNIASSIYLVGISFALAFLIV